MKFVCHSSKLLPGHMRRGEGVGVLPCYTIGEVCPPRVIFKFPWIICNLEHVTVHGLRRNILRLCLFRGTFRNFLGEDPSSTTRKMVPITGQASSFPNSNLNPN